MAVVSSPSQSGSRFHLPQISHNQAAIAAGAIGAAALAVAAYATTAIFMPAVGGSLNQTGAIILASTMGTTALVIGGGLLTVHIIKTRKPSVDWDGIQDLPIAPNLGERLKAGVVTDGTTSIPAFAPVRVNGRTYHFGGFEPYLVARQENLPKAKDEYVAEIFKFDIVVNLMNPDPEHEQQYMYTGTPYFNGLYPDSKNSGQGYVKYSSAQGSKTLYNILGWVDGNTIPMDRAIALYRHARMIMAEAVNKTIFIHCFRGLSRTSTFTILCELAANS